MNVSTNDKDTILLSLTVEEAESLAGLAIWAMGGAGAEADALLHTEAILLQHGIDDIAAATT